MDTHIRGRANRRRLLITLLTAAPLALTCAHARADVAAPVPPLSSSWMEPLAYFLVPLLPYLVIPVTVIAVLVVAGESSRRKRQDGDHERGGSSGRGGDRSSDNPSGGGGDGGGG